MEELATLQYATALLGLSDYHNSICYRDSLRLFMDKIQCSKNFGGKTSGKFGD